MKYKFFSILMMMSIIVGCAKPNIIMQDFETEKIIHYSQMKNIDNISDYVFYLNKGDKILLEMTLDSELLDIANEDISLVLKQKVYFRLKMPEGINAEETSAMSEEVKQKYLKSIMIYLSSDAKSWAPYTDIKAVEQIFGIKSGSISIGMGITKEDGIRVHLNVKTNRL